MWNVNNVCGGNFLCFFGECGNDGRMHHSCLHGYEVFLYSEVKALICPGRYIFYEVLKFILLQ